MAKKFIRKDTHKKKRLPVTWRKPKGITNKMRLNRKGHSPNVRPGYGKKESNRGKTTTGLIITEVFTLEQLKNIDVKTQAALIMGLGKKKKLELLVEAEKLKITLVNFNAKTYKEKAEKFLETKKKESAQRKEQQKAIEKAESAAKEEKVAKDKLAEKVDKEEKTQEQKKKEEKEEKDKVLLKGQ